jgi:hypothetical protein
MPAAGILRGTLAGAALLAAATPAFAISCPELPSNTLFVQLIAPPCTVAPCEEFLYATPLGSTELLPIARINLDTMRPSYTERQALYDAIVSGRELVQGELIETAEGTVLRATGTVPADWLDCPRPEWRDLVAPQ